MTYEQSSPSGHSLFPSPVILPSLHFPLIKQSFDYCRSNFFFLLFCSSSETPVALSHRFSELINRKHFLSLSLQFYFYFFKLNVAVCCSSANGRFPLTFITLYTSYIWNICNCIFCKTSSNQESCLNSAQHSTLVLWGVRCQMVLAVLSMTVFHWESVSSLQGWITGTENAACFEFFLHANFPGVFSKPGDLIA